MKLVTERLSLQSITVEDWPLFLRLYQDPEVIRYISDPRSEAEIRTRFGGAAAGLGQTRRAVAVPGDA